MLKPGNRGQQTEKKNSSWQNIPESFLDGQKQCQTAIRRRCAQILGTERKSTEQIFGTQVDQRWVALVGEHGGVWRAVRRREKFH